MRDDSQYGRYECDAFAVDDPVARKHGFSVIGMTLEDVITFIIIK